MPVELPEIRCSKCDKVITRGNIVEGTIECKNGHLNVINNKPKAQKVVLGLGFQLNRINGNAPAVVK